MAQTGQWNYIIERIQKMREYETTYILEQSLSDADVDQTIGKIGEIIKKNNGDVLHSQNIGRKALAYRLKKQTKGIYASLDFYAESAVVAEIERYLKYNEKVLRHLTVVLADTIDPDARRKQLEEEAIKLAAKAAMAKDAPPTTNRYNDD